MKTSNKLSSNIANNVQENLAKLYKSGANKEIICVYRILCQVNNISTNEIFQLALTPDFERECVTCASADNVYRALKTLQEKGWIIGALKKGGYYWHLICE